MRLRPPCSARSWAPSKAPVSSPCPGRPRTGSPRRRPLLRFESVTCASLSSCFLPRRTEPSSDRSRSGLVPADPGMILRCRLTSTPPPIVRHRSAVRRPVIRPTTGAHRLASRPRSGPRSRRPHRHLLGPMAGDQVAAADVPELRVDRRAVLRVAELLAQPAPGVEAAAGRRGRRRGHVALQDEPLLADPRIRVGDGRQERHACTGGADGGTAPRPSASSTSLPRYITPTRSLMYWTTDRLWAMNR